MCKIHQLVLLGKSIECFYTVLYIFMQRTYVLFHIPHTWLNQIFRYKFVECREFVIKIWVFKFERFMNVLDGKLSELFLTVSHMQLTHSPGASRHFGFVKQNSLTRAGHFVSITVSFLDRLAIVFGDVSLAVS